MHIGLLGAAFNPPHIGHLIMARQAMDFARFDQIWFMPTYHHTFVKQTETPQRRMAMTRLLIKDCPQFKVSTLEIDHQLDGNTINVLPILKQNYPHDQFTFIIGADNLPTFHKWGSWKKLLQLLPFLVIPRAGFSNAPLFENMRVLEHPLLVVTNISSTGIRARIKQGLAIDYLVTPQVKEYIKTHRLYK